MPYRCAQCCELIDESDPWWYPTLEVKRDGDGVPELNVAVAKAPEPPPTLGASALAFHPDCLVERLVGRTRKRESPRPV